MEELQERVENENRQEKLVKKGKKFSFEAPELARKPSVYEDKSHVTIIRAAIILILVCLVIAVIWFGFYATRSKTKDPTFVQPSQPTVEGEVPTEEQSNQEEPNTQDQTSSTDIQMTRNDQLDFSFRLPENSETFVFKIEFGQKSWAQLTVNGQN